MSEELNGNFRILNARLRDKSAITFKAHWQGYGDFSWSESGKGATWDHPFDDRRCHWTATGRIVRSIAIVVVGQEYWRDDLTTAFTAASANQGSAFQFGDFQAENCGMCEARRESDFRNMREQINAALDGTIEKDLPNVIASLKALPEVLELDA
ncbi:hypothetical protein [Sphingomonas sp. M1A8_2b]